MLPLSHSRKEGINKSREEVEEEEKVLTPVVPDFSEEITHYIPADFEENGKRKKKNEEEKYHKYYYYY